MVEISLNSGYIILIFYSITLCVAREVHSRKQNIGDVIHYCPPCDMRQCEHVSPDNCVGIVMKDVCNCCPVCNPISEPMVIDGVPATTSDNESQPDACTGFKCQRHQICLLNIQGLPVCRCPTIYYCKNKPRQKVCSSDGDTYPSICHLKMTACDQGRKITVVKKGACDDDPAKQAKEQRARQRQQRLREREKERQEKAEAKRLEKEIKHELKRQQRMQQRAETSHRPENRKKDRGNRRGNRNNASQETTFGAELTREERRKDRKRQKRIERQTVRETGSHRAGRKDRQLSDGI